MRIRSTPTKNIALAFAAALITFVAPRAACAQDEMQGMDMSGPHLSIGASAIGLFTRVSPAFLGKPMSEGYLTQPVLMLHGSALHEHITLYGTLNAEGLTLKRGELNPGGWGEGYVDRRHPHTYLHELIVSANTTLFGTRASLSAGKGFPAYGTDDPMTRPFVKYPVNHHLSQILERYVLIGGVRRNKFILEGSLFNGDEPTSPGDFPNANHFGDSRAFRATILPLKNVEAQVSHAYVTSPENVFGRGLNQRKWSASVRYGESQAESAHPYLLVEWARTQDVHAGSPLIGFTSVLTEGAVRSHGFQLAARYERTSRPEEERLIDPFRTVRPAPDFSIIGSTRWDIGTVALRTRFGAFGWLNAEPFIEVERAHVTKVEQLALFDPALFYGSSNLWSLSLGARIELGALHMRMGRYGAAEVGGGMSHGH